MMKGNDATRVDPAAGPLPIKAMGLEHFLAEVVPAVGNFATFWSGTKRHYWANTHEQFAELIKGPSERPDTYFALAAFKIGGSRKAANADRLKALWIDMDAGHEKLAKHGPDKVYTDRDTAFLALQQFVETTGFRPTQVMSSGEGLHVYFALVEEMSVMTWKPLAQRLESFCLRSGLMIDAGVTTDAARVLRAPGTLHKNGRRVAVLDLPWTRGPYTMQELAEALGPDDRQPKRRPGAEDRQTRHPYLPETPEMVQLLKEALRAIPAEVSKGCDRGLWMRVCFGTLATRWDCAYDLARSWSESGGGDFVEHDFEALVKSEKGTPNPRETTPFFVFKTAERFGWETNWRAFAHECSEAEAEAEAETDTKPNEWMDPEAIAPPLPAVQPFDTAWLPKCARAYVHDQTELMQTPPDFLAVSLMVCLAATIGNRITIAPKAQDTSWLVPVTLWGGLIGRPGVLKSPTVSRATSFMDNLETSLVAAFDQRLQAYKLQKLTYENWQKQAKTGIGKGLAVTPMPEPEEPQPERLLINDSTFQKLTDVLRASPRGVLVCRDELTGLLESLRTQGQEQARAGYLEAWNGLNRYRVDRVGRGSFVIQRMFLCMLGGIQPGKLEPYIKEATNGGSGDDGLLQRFQLLVWPDAPEAWINVDRAPDWDAAKTVEDTFEYLHTLDPAEVQANVDPTGRQPPYLQFDASAQRHFDAWWEKLETSLRSGRHLPALEAHLAKYRSLIPALALVVHLSDRATGPVTKSALARAIKWGGYLLSHAKRVYACVTHSQTFGANVLAKRLKAGDLSDGFTARTIQRKGWHHLSTPDDVRRALEWLVDAHWLRLVHKGSGSNGGKPTETYIINPNIRSEGA